MATQNKISPQAAKYELWRRGSTSWLLDPTQKELRNLYLNSKDKINVWLLARRSGKSYTLLTLALEICNAKPKSIVKYIGPTKNQIKSIARPLMEKLLESCPEDLKPELKESDYIYYFPNGSEIQMAGADSGHAEKLRGSDANLVLVDEAGSIDGLRYIIQSILLPTTLVTKGKIILASTPPIESEHDFLYYIEEAEAKNTIVKKTIYDNSRLNAQDLIDAENEMGGAHTDAFRREYKCEILKDANTSVIPEFDDANFKEIVKEWPKPPYFDAYVAMDLGFKDLTALVFGYYDFRAAKIIIEDELVIDFRKNDMNLKKLCDLIKEKEEQLWTNVLTNEVRKPSIRVSDIDYIVLSEISKASHGLIHFTAANKYDKESSINTLRTMISSRKIIIHPRCSNLIRHLKNAKWSKNKQGFARSVENGHYDLVDALLYFTRAVMYTKNPYPSSYGYTQKDLFIQNPEKFEKNSTYEDVFKKIFNIKPKKQSGIR
jgi:hypothetical protein